MRRSLAFSTSLLAGVISFSAVMLASPGRAEAAYDSLAKPCAGNQLFCQVAPIKFDHVDELPIQWSFDTGWVPQNSPLQVHIWAAVYANTHVALTGGLMTSWPEALTLETPGDVDGGDFDFHYGAEFGAQGKIQVTVAGKTYSWTGDLPFIPQFDFQVQAQTGFDAWAFDPGVVLSSKTNPQKIAKIGIGDIVGGSIPGIDGGFELDVAMELQATYTTTQIVIDKTSGEEVEGGPITKNISKTKTPYLSGPSIELDVHPEGTVDYDGILHMIPAFYVSLLGQSWTIPIADIPIGFPITKTDWVFDSQRVHVPLPDLVVNKKTIDFGEVEVGQKSLIAFSLWNAGEAKVAAIVSSSDPDNFPPWDTALGVNPNETIDTAVRFIPKQAGDFVAQLFVDSNDPSDPKQIIELRGHAFGGDPPPVDTTPDPDLDSGCGCRTAGAPSSRGFEGLGLAALLFGSIVARRRKRALS